MPITFAKLGQYGRLGNCLFQMAATIALAHRNNDDFMFPFWEHAKDIKAPPEKFGHVTFNSTFAEPHFHYAGIPYSPNLNLHGYFQSYKYFQDEDHIISPLLSPKYDASDCEATSIHVRRTDYLVHKGCYNILNLQNYYERAMEITGGDKFLVFSDDIQWCKRHFIGNQFEFSEGNSAAADLAIMSKCKNNIIANSSFSWWAAWFNKRPGKIVVAPKVWFGPSLAPTHDTKDLLPDDWEKV